MADVLDRTLFGNAVRDARRALGWSQSALAERSGVSRPTIARLEAGRGVSSTSLLKLAKALDLQIALEPQEKHR
ncbi:helix-turn-helix transcriptional regulator [Tessaracoccus flavescens]|uniref:helix-turn-helix transcriptional regulator n=1 Tax=Tessaracoccus flavescens TaxID=399497 RepID=UPI0009876141|nr:helix-turn-helix transcriptional regulator [Tessaracoccus flavescens]